MRPLNIGETLDAAIKIVRSRWKTLAGIMLVVAIPIEALTIAVTLGTTDSYDVTGGGATYTNDTAYVIGELCTRLLTFAGYALGLAACYRAIADTYLGRETSAAASLRAARRRLGPAVLLLFVVWIGVLVASVFFLLPGIWLAVAWSVALPAMLVEDVRGSGALGRSFRLVRKRWWPTFARIVVALILVVVVTMVLTVAFMALVALVVDGTSFGALLLQGVADVVVMTVTMPFLAAITLLVYFDLRVRKEGFDLAVLAERLGGEPAATPAAAAPAALSHGGDGAGGERGAADGAGAWAPPLAREQPPTAPPGE